MKSRGVPSLDLSMGSQGVWCQGVKSWENTAERTWLFLQNRRDFSSWKCQRGILSGLRAWM